MKFTFACKKISLNDSIKEYAEKKISKLDKYFPEEADAFVTFAVEKKNRCVVELTIRAANGTLFRAQTEDPDGDMRCAIDEAVSFIDRRIRKNKTRLAKNLRPDALVGARRYGYHIAIIARHFYQMSYARRIIAVVVTHQYQASVFVLHFLFLF